MPERENRRAETNTDVKINLETTALMWDAEAEDTPRPLWDRF